MTRRRMRQEWVHNLAKPQVREAARIQLRQLENATVENAAAPEAELYIYDVIDSWGGEWGVSAQDVVDLLAECPTGTVLNVRLNSPGGDYFEGVAIANALRRHDGPVNTYVDGMAASAASVIAMAGEKIVMGLGSQLMIHEASTIAIGTAKDMRACAEMLDQTNDDIAQLYAVKSGGDVAVLRQQMRDETWFTGELALAAGLATELAGKPPYAPDEDCDCGKDSCDECSGQGEPGEDEQAPPKKTKNDAELAEVFAGFASELRELRALVTAHVSRETSTNGDTVAFFVDHGITPPTTPEPSSAAAPVETPAPLPSAGFDWSEALVSALTEGRS